MDYTIATRPGYAYLVIANQTIQLTADETAALNSSLEHASYEAKHKLALSQQAQARDAFLVGIRPMAEECPTWEKPMSDTEIRRTGPWLTDGWVAVCEAALTSGAAAQLEQRRITPVTDRIAQVLADKIANTTRRPAVTPAGWMQVHSPQGTRDAVVTFDEAGEAVILFDARAWRWAYEATGATRVSGCTDSTKIAVFWNASDDPVAVLQCLATNLDWQPGAASHA